jgi:hypothetical protein
MTDSSLDTPREMAATGATASSRVFRFDRVERAAHWVNALLFGILMATALPLYFAQVESIVGRRALIAEIHVWAGVALPVPLIISLAGPWGLDSAATCVASTCGPGPKSAG